MRSTVNAYRAAVNAGDAEAVVGLLTRDFELIPPDAAPVRGADAQKLMREMLTESAIELAPFSDEEWFVASDLAVQRYTFHLNERPKNGGEARLSHGTGIHIWRRGRDGAPDCSYKGGLPGFVRMVDDRTLAIPDYDGNGQYRTWGNVLVNPRVGLLFIDFETPKRLRVNGSAVLSQDEDRFLPADERAMVNRFLTKPISPDQLLAEVASTLADKASNPVIANEEMT